MLICPNTDPYAFMGDHQLDLNISDLTRSKRTRKCIKGINQIDLIGYDLRQVSLGLSIADVPGSSSAFINTLTIVNPYGNGNTPF